MRFLGIYREHMFSPGRVDDDAAIMDATLGALRTEGHDVDAINAELLDGQACKVDCVLTMGQSQQVLNLLEESKSRGVRIINAVSSIRLCYRSPLLTLLASAGLPLPPSNIVLVEDAEKRIELKSSKPCWVKRGDIHKVEPDDVVKVESQREFETCLDHFRRKRIAEIVVQEHAEGKVIKFYGVSARSATRQPYFKAFPEGGDVEITDDMTELRGVAARAAAAVGLEVYGGDAVITATGRVILLDLNAWPSFARCRTGAAQNIAGYVLSNGVSY